MNLFSFLSRSALKPDWSHSVQHVLWRIMFSRSGAVIIEDRDTEAKSATFSCIEARTGTPLWSGKELGEQWWIGLAAVTEDRLYLHGFRKPDMPEQKDIYAVDLKSGELVWKNTECTFIGLQPPYLYGFKDLFERRLFYRLDAASGAIEEELTALPEGLEPNMQYERTDFQFPQPVTAPEGTQNAEQIAVDGFHITTAYVKNNEPEEGLKNLLTVIDSTTNKKVYSDVLNASTPYPVPDAFFADGSRLYYIKERKTFVAVELKR